MTKNQIDYYGVLVDEAKLEEEKRHNLATEQFTAQHYARSDEASLRQAAASESQAEVARSLVPINQMNAVTNRMSVEESMRHNQAVEQENFRHNEMTEALASKEVSEKVRHNVELENQGWSQLGETRRHDLATESLNEQQLKEVGRHNLATETQALMSLVETQRHNVAGETVSRGSLAESIRHNKTNENISRDSLSESITHNRATEKISWAQVNLDKETLAVRQREANIKQQEADTHYSAFIAETANEAIKRTQDKRRLDIMEKQAEKPASQVNVTNNDYSTNDYSRQPQVYTHTGGGGSTRSDGDDGFFERTGDKVDNIIDAVVNFLTGG